MPNFGITFLAWLKCVPKSRSKGLTNVSLVMVEWVGSRPVFLHMLMAGRWEGTLALLLPDR